MEQAPKGAVKDEVTYFFLITLTEKGAVLSAAQRKKERSDVAKFVKKEGGNVTSTRPGVHPLILSASSPVSPPPQPSGSQKKSGSGGL
jgi:hypothetical protein